MLNVNNFIPEVNIYFVLEGIYKFEKNDRHVLDVFFELAINIELAQLQEFFIDFFPIFKFTSEMHISNTALRNNSFITKVFFE